MPNQLTRMPDGEPLRRRSGAKAIADHITAILDALPAAIAERLREDMARFRREAEMRRVGPYRDRRGAWARKNVKDNPPA